MRYAQIREIDISNGENIGISLFVQGCNFHCKGCFNQETWNFDGGYEWTPETEARFIDLLGKPYVKRVSVLGGEPLADENMKDVLCLLKKIRSEYPDKKIWLYTGNTFEGITKVDFFSYMTPYVKGEKTLYECADLLWRAYLKCIKFIELLKYIDVLVDGKFEVDKRDITLKFRGSSNQRIIDVQKSLELGKVIKYMD